MRILAYIVTGIIAGWIAGELVFGDGFGLFGNLVVGVIGALVGGFVLDMSGTKTEGQGLLPHLLTSILGAVITLVLVNIIF